MTESSSYLPYPGDPFVEWFLNNEIEPEKTVAKLYSFPEPRHPKYEAMLLLRLSGLDSSKFSSAFQTADSAYSEKSDVNLHLVFLIFWASALSFRADKFPQLQSLIREINSLVTDSTPAAIKLWAAYPRSVLAFKTGNVVASDQAIQESLSYCTPSSSHSRGIRIYHRLSMLQRGMGASCAESLSGLPPHVAARVAVFELVNAAAIGDLKLAFKLFNSFKAKMDAALNPDQGIISYDVEVARHLLLLLQATSTSEDSVSGSDVSRLPSDVPAWVRSTQALLNLKLDEALLHARDYALVLNRPISRTIVGFDEYCLIRAELANKNSAAALRLMEQRIKSGTIHYIDDFFLGRAKLLTGQQAESEEHFSKLKNNISFYRAHGRLRLELALAHEVPPMLVLKLMELPIQQPASPRQAITPTLTKPKPSKPSRGAEGLDRLIFQSPQMTEIGKLLETVAKVDTPVLITGETGTGKELVARAIHELSPRSKQPFIAVNCGAISESLIESELFGHKKGAFTGATVNHKGLFVSAGAGTIFLDEIGEITPRIQVALLRVLELGEIRSIGCADSTQIECRVIAATNVNLPEMLANKQMRSDLFYRLNRLEIQLPALRGRPSDILPLAKFFLNEDRNSNETADLSADLADALAGYNWPGNVRELKNAMNRMRLLTSDKLFYELKDIEVALPNLNTLPQNTPKPRPLSTEGKGSAGVSSTEDKQAQVKEFLLKGSSELRRLERLEELFNEHRRLKVQEVAHLLQISRNTASRYLQALCEKGIITKISPNASHRTSYYEIIK